MGGYGSGRAGGRHTIEAVGCFTLDVKALRPILNIPGQHVVAAITFCPGASEELKVGLEIDTRHATWPTLTLAHASRTAGEEAMRYTVHIDRLTPHYGGCRWYFLCPRTGERVTKLRLPRGGFQFWSRQAYRLGYATQREDAMGRAQRRMMKMHRAMGSDGSFDDYPPPKAKWRRWAKYERQAAMYDDLSDRVDRAFMFRAMRIVASADARMKRRRQ